MADGGPQFTVPLASSIGKSYFAGTMANARLPMKISYCTTCRNRIEHLQQTLPRSLDALRDGDELVILDYGSAEPIKPVVARFRHPALRLYRVADTPRYRRAHAKNVAHLLAMGDFLVNLDADNTLTDGYVAWLTETLGAEPNAIAFSEAWGGGGGRIGLPRAVFSALGGYDERFEGWGYEDGDLLARARGLGLPAVKAPDDLVEFITHEDSLRESDKEATRNQAMRLSEAAIAQRQYVANAGCEWGVAAEMVHEILD